MYTGIDTDNDVIRYLHFCVHVYLPLYLCLIHRLLLMLAFRSILRSVFVFILISAFASVVL